MKKAIGAVLSTIGVLSAAQSFAAPVEKISLALQDPEVQKLIQDQSRAHAELISVKDRLIEAVWVTGAPVGAEHVIELTFVARPRPGGTPAPVVCQVAYALDATSVPSEVVSRGCRSVSDGLRDNSRL